MAIRNTSIIQQLFRTAESIQFHASFDVREVPSITIIVRNPQEASEGYELIQKSNTTRLVLSLNRKKEVLNVSILDFPDGDEISIPNLAFDADQLAYYTKVHASDQAFMLMIGYYQSGYLMLTASDQAESPLVFNGYELL